MKFAHLADIHLGAWREPRLRELSLQSFVLAMDTAFNEKVDFVLIAGDLFHTAVPTIDNLRLAVKKFKEAKGKGIPIYIIAGSHDFSPAGKTMIDVLEEAGLVVNVMRGRVNEEGILTLGFTVDRKTGAKLAGIIGKRGMLDRHYYERLGCALLEREEGFKIFLFHTALEELRPAELKEMDAAPVSLLPKGFDYYAGGHVHVVRKADLPGYRNIVFPGPTFPANFAELERLGCGTMYIHDSTPQDRTAHDSRQHDSRQHDSRQHDSAQHAGASRLIRLALKKTVLVNVETDKGTKGEIMEDIARHAKDDHADAIVLVRIAGTVKNALPSDILVRDIAALFPRAYYVMVNKARLAGESFTGLAAAETSVEETELSMIRDHIAQAKIDFGGQEEQAITQLIKVLSTEKLEGEKVAEYQSRIKRLAEDVLRLSP